MSFMKEIELLRIPFKDIEEATKNFTTQIGRGGYGLVYRGELSVSEKLTAVAVKRLQTDHRFGHGLKEFLTEIQLLSRYKHKNIVSFLGFCEEQNEKVLIYKYAERGSLDSYLKPSKNRPPLTWKQRISICVDGARGLDHLHNHVAQNERVIHRDIKSANILIDQNWKAMIADFGLSKLGRANENITYLISNPCGTLGYVDPTYFRTGVLTKKSDVYSFGVVLVEVLCGRLCFIKVNSTDPLLAPLAQSYYQDKKLNLIIDPCLKNHINSDSMKIFLEIAFQCLHDDREQRPSMGLVLEKLEKVLELLEKEEAPELRELEEALELKKLVETLQKQQFEDEEAWMHSRRSPTVTNLMDLEALPDSASGKQKESGLDRIRTSQVEDLNLVSESFKPTPIKMHGSSRLSIEPTPWKQRDLEFTQSGKDLRALQQILEAMQLKARIKETQTMVQRRTSNRPVSRASKASTKRDKLIPLGIGGYCHTPTDGGIRRDVTIVQKHVTPVTL